MKWAWKGRELAPPWVILRRLFGLMILTPGLWMTFLGTLVGWGLSDAKYFWEHRHDY